MERSGLGLSSFVSVGDHADVDTNDVLEYWEDDEATGVVSLWSSWQPPPVRPPGAPRLARQACGRAQDRPDRRRARGRGLRRHAHRHKDERGRCAAGRGRGHPGTYGHRARRHGTGRRRSAASRRPADRHREHLGRTGTRRRRDRRGPRSGGRRAQYDDLAPHRPPPGHTEHAPTNPIDVGAVSPAQLEAVLDAVLADPGVEAAIAISAPPNGGDRATTAAAVASAASRSTKPVLGCLAGSNALLPALAPRGDRRVPWFPGPERAAALARAAAYRSGRDRPVRRTG